MAIEAQNHLVPKFNLGTTTSGNKEWILWAFFFFIQISSLINLSILPQAPVIPLISLALLVLLSSLFFRKLLLLLILLSILTSETLYFEAGPVVIRGFDFLLLFALILFSAKWLIEKKNKFEDLPVFKLALSLLVLTALVSLIGTISLKNSLLEFVQTIELIIAAYIFFNIIKTEADIKFLFLVILPYSVLDALWILFQYWTGELLGRHIGLFQTLAFELSYGTAIATAFFYMTKKKWLKFIMLLSAALQIMAIYLSNGRGLFITAVLMAMLCNFVFALQKKKISSFVYITGAILFAFLISSLILNPEIENRYTSIIEGGEMRDLRLIIWAISLKIWQSFPLLGVGFGNAELALVQFSPKPFGIALTALADVKTPHNEYLSFAVQAGLFGFITGLLFYAILFRNSILIYRKSKGRLKEYSIILLAFISGLLVWNMANDTLLAGKGMLIMLFIAILCRIYSLKKI